MALPERRVDERLEGSEGTRACGYRMAKPGDLMRADGKRCCRDDRSGNGVIEHRAHTCTISFTFDADRTWDVGPTSDHHLESPRYALRCPLPSAQCLLLGQPERVSEHSTGCTGA